MGWEFCSYTTTVETVNEPTSFAGKHTGLPTRLNDTLYMDENTAANALCDALDKRGCMYATYIDYDPFRNKVNTVAYQRAHVQFTKAIARKKALVLDAVNKARDCKTRTCPNCKKRVNMQGFARMLNNVLHSLSVDTYLTPVSGQCPHCADKTLPLTHAQRRDIAKADERLDAASDKREQAEESAVRALHRAGKLGTRAVVVGLLHEIDARPYNDEHYDEDDEEYDGF